MGKAAKLKKRLTKSAVDGTTAPEPDPNGKWRETRVWDTEIPGFFLRVYTSGRKMYFLKYGRGKRGAGRYHEIGEHGKAWKTDATGDGQVLTADLARMEALRLLGELAAGRDPAGARQQARAMPTLKEFALQRYLPEHSVDKAPRSYKEDKRNFERVILPRLGSLRLDQVTGGHISGFKQARKETPINTNRCLALLSHAFNMARVWGVLPPGHVNPVSDVPRFKENKKERYLSEGELADVGVLLRRAEDASKKYLYSTKGVFVLDPYAIAAIRLLIFTGLRISDVVELRWDQVDLKAELLRRVHTKAGKGDLPMNAPTRKLLKDLPHVGGNPHVFPARYGKRRKAGKHMTVWGLRQSWERLRAKVKGLDDVTPHTLRHSFASVAVAGGNTLPIIGALLGHARPETTARYAHLSRDPLKKATDAIASKLESAMGKRKAKG